MVSDIDLNRRSFLAAAAGLSAATALSGCATTIAQPAKAPSDISNYFFETMAARNEAISSVNFDKDISDWLPNRLFEVEGKAARPLGAGLVTGSISKVTGGRGYVVGKDDEESGTVVPFESPEALWRTVDVTMNVTQSWGKVAQSEAVHFGIAFGGNKDSERIIADLSSLDSVVAAFLEQGFFRYDPSLYGIGRNGLLLGAVDGSGGLRFPSLAALDGAGDAEKEFLGDSLTTRELEAQAGKAREVVRVEGGERR